MEVETVWERSECQLKQNKSGCVNKIKAEKMGMQGVKGNRDTKMLIGRDKDGQDQKREDQLRLSGLEKKITKEKLKRDEVEMVWMFAEEWQWICYTAGSCLKGRKEKEIKMLGETEEKEMDGVRCTQITHCGDPRWR